MDAVTCACGNTCVCHGGGAFPPPCPVPGGCGLPAAPGPVCAATGCDAAPDPVLCAAHGRQLGDRLAAIGARYNTLSAAPSLQGREPGTGSGGTLASQRSVGLLHVMALRDRRTAADPDDRLRSVPAVLFGWAGQVRDEQKINRPTRPLTARLADAPPGPVCDTWCAHDTCRAWTFRALGYAPRTVATERKLLADQLPWILGQDWAGDFWAEIDELWELLAALVNPAGTVPCPKCDGAARWTGSRVSCPGCGHTAAGLDVLRQGAA